MVARSAQPLVTLSLKLAHVLISQRNPFTLAEDVMKPCLKTAAQEVHEETSAVIKVHN